ncbi:MAG: SCO family protein [Alphaproteobacteria bacterium]
MRRATALLLVALATWSGASAYTRPEFTPEIGATLSLDSPFRTGDGQAISLKEALAEKPALMIFGYAKCPNLCGVAQTAVANALSETGLDERDYNALFISIDSNETSRDAREARAKLADATDEDVVRPWRFLTDAGGAGARLARESGLTFQTRTHAGQFVHPIAIFALTPDARIARVLPAMAFEARDLRLALVEASRGRLGSVADQVFLLCAGFDDSKGRYTSVVMASLQIGGFLTVLLLSLAILVLLFRRNRS